MCLFASLSISGHVLVAFFGNVFCSEAENNNNRCSPVRNMRVLDLKKRPELGGLKTLQTNLKNPFLSA